MSPKFISNSEPQTQVSGSNPPDQQSAESGKFACSVPPSPGDDSDADGTSTLMPQDTDLTFRTIIGDSSNGYFERHIWTWKRQPAILTG